jgi:hypothetical protein
MRRYLTTKYFISNDGKVLNSKTGRFLKNQNNGNGYEKITLTIDGIQCQKLIHRLVADLYIPRVKNKNQVNHINGIKNDNRVENLEWCNNKENQIHAHINGLKQNGNGLWNGKFSKEDIEKIKTLKNNGVLQYKIAEIMNTTKGTISSILNGKRYKYL